MEENEFPFKQTPSVSEQTLQSLCLVVWASCEKRVRSLRAG